MPRKKINKDFTINYNAGGNLKTTGGTVSGIVAEKTPEQLLSEKCLISTGSGLFCDDFSVDSNAQVRINLKNMLTEDISAVTVTLTNGGGGTGSCTNAAPAAITADGVTVVTLACDPTLLAKVKGDLSITYTVGGFTKTTTGSIIGMVP